MQRSYRKICAIKHKGERCVADLPTYDILDDEHIFISFDCAYRTLGWCILGFNPTRTIIKLREFGANLPQIPRDIPWFNMFHLIGKGVEDVLGAKIKDVNRVNRAKLLADTIARIIPRKIIARATIVIEEQLRAQMLRGGFRVAGGNADIEAQLLMYFTAVEPARKIILINSKIKKKYMEELGLSSANLPYNKRYDANKCNSCKAFGMISTQFNFGDVGKTVIADEADACIQILATIFLHPEYI
jgi:hypothetical protein